MILYEKHESAAVLTLNRPEKRNSLCPELIAQFTDALIKAETDSSIKTVIITGSGSAFCAGADLEYLRDLSSYSAIDNLKDSGSIAELFLKIYKFPKPVIAAVNGPAIAGGCGLASVSDFIIADEKNAKFGYSEVKIGFLPAIVSIFLIKRIGEGNTKQLLLSGEIIDAKTAYEMGFVNYLAGNPVKKAYELAKLLDKNSLYSMSVTKKMINDVSLMSVDEAVKYCLQLNVISRGTEDFKNGINNFLKK